MDKVILEVKGIRKTYDKKKYVLNGIDLKLSEGDMAVIEGKSGAGKSTLMNIIGLLDEYNEGELYIENELLDKHNRKRHKVVRGEKIGFVFQAYHLIEAISVKENILLPFMYCNKAIDKSVMNKYEDLVNDLGLGELTDKKISCLSGGEKQRVAIARAVIKEPKIIIADEPTGNLDKENTDIVIENFRRLREQGKVIVVVTHDISISKKEDKKFYLKEGRLELCKA